MSSHLVERAWISALPSGISFPSGQTDWDGVKRLLARQFTGSHFARNLSRSVWASHHRADAKLGPIYDFLSTKSTDNMQSTSPLVRAATQSCRLVEGVLHYRSIRDIWVPPLREGWVVAVPLTLQKNVITECHSDGWLPWSCRHHQNCVDHQEKVVLLENESCSNQIRGRVCSVHPSKVLRISQGSAPIVGIFLLSLQRCRSGFVFSRKGFTVGREVCLHHRGSVYPLGYSLCRFRPSHPRRF